MNDFEFAHKTHPQIGKLYSEAKLSLHRFPKHTLTLTRGLASLCCDLLRPDNWTDWPEGLNEKIKALKKAHKINPETFDTLKALQLWGNWAAHPEESRKEEEDFNKLANTALDKAIGLLETVFQHKNRGATLPDYEISHDSSDELKNACFRALIENSAEDQYQVAMQLQRDIASKKKELKKENPLEPIRLNAEIKALGERSLDLLSYAANACHPPSSYQYGLALSKGDRGDMYVNVGINHIRTAAQDGNIDALAWCGQSALNGWHDEPINFELARKYLEMAAAEDHPRALSLLSEMYRKGQGVAVDKKTAYDLMLRAAEAGYPHAQYQTFVALWHGVGVKADQEAAITWLQLASNAGFPEAQKYVGLYTMAGLMPGEFTDGEKLLHDAIKEENEAHLDLAVRCMSRKVPTELFRAAGLVQEAFEKALNTKNQSIKERALQLAPELLKRLEELIPEFSDKEFDDYLVARFKFDIHGQPFPNLIKRLDRFDEIILEWNKLKKSGTPEAKRLILELVSGKRTTKKVDPYDSCICTSERKYKFCCYELHRAVEKENNAFRVSRN